MCSETQKFWLKAVRDVGFPIIAFFVMAWMCVNTIDQNTQALEELTSVIRMMN